jgi:hypothetical protein
MPQRFWIIGAVILLCLTFFLGGVLWRLSRVAPTPSPELDLEPGVAELNDPVNEGDSARARLHVVNRGEQSAEITGVHATCSCTSIATSDGKPFVAPVEIGPHGVVDLNVTINTSDHVGQQEMPVALDARVGDREVHRASKVRLFVRAGWRANPAQLLFDETVPRKPVTRTIELFDGHPDPGIRLKEIRVSDPKRLNAQFVETKVTKLASNSLAGPDGSDAGLKKRYNILVTLMPPETTSKSEFSLDLVTLIPADARNPERSLVVQWRNLQPAIRLVPDSLTVVLPEGATVIRRRVQCLSQGVALTNRKLRVLSKPDFIHVSVGATDDRSTPILLECNVVRGDDLPRNTEIQFAVGESRQPALTLPICLLRSY